MKDSSEIKKTEEFSFNSSNIIEIVIIEQFLSMFPKLHFNYSIISVATRILDNFD
ncbi:MAG: hypothetical protein ACK4F0_05105 [Candidatus Ratteibacteria bacterium]